MRGNWVSEVLLGEKLPRPPANVPQLPEGEDTSKLSVRQLVEQHTRDARCAHCHVRIDPFGFALEGYDPIGRRRQKDLGGHAVDTRATLRDGSTFEGVEGLRRYLLKERREDFLRTFCRKLVGYALGRSVTLADQPLVSAVCRQWDMLHGAIHDFREPATGLSAAGHRFQTVGDRLADGPGTTGFIAVWRIYTASRWRDLFGP